MDILTPSLLVKLKKVYKLNHESSRVEEIQVPNGKNDFNEYLDELIQDILNDDRSKKYNFPDEDTEIISIIRAILKSKEETKLLGKIAKRLLRIEMFTQEKIDHLNKEIQRGVLVVSLVESKNRKYFVIAKAEHFEFINELDRKKAQGLPIKKKIFKSFVTYIGNDETLEYAMVGDSKPRISSYWWHEFLELLEVYSSDYNTEKAWDVLERKVFNPMRTDFKADRTYLRNATVHYFRKNQEFVLSDYITNVIDAYEPEDKRLDVNGLSAKIRELPEKEKFDSRFTIAKEKLKKKVKTSIRLSPELMLEIQNSTDLKSIVTPFENKGLKYISIRTDSGYDHFTSGK